MKRLREIIPRGLAGKLIKFVTVLVFILGVAFMLMSSAGMPITWAMHRCISGMYRPYGHYPSGRGSKN